ncbi:hypothetical protein NIBR502772_19365 [Pseudarthrobacter sp. NIBRBAC000502772]|uniref:hypothetical protein n=1 Tax=Pseudarthrobacter sp. NIBRBAC000502772 TaxID=2590775 RepID=UPI00113151D1|nr:hypothetical protein [Pseudarthrobacter sp. NIBRBAC000502772]QDG68077.1 hypothetical protein NIBR502772_19365 [Pseudarthrobacter sp. NIBRBAC000502772]
MRGLDSTPPQSQQYGHPPCEQQPGQQPYGDPGHQYGRAPSFTQTPKSGLPVWGWVAGGVGVVAVIAVAGILAFNGLAGGTKDPDAVPALAPSISDEAAPQESADTSPIAGAEAAGAIYLFD